MQPLEICGYEILGRLSKGVFEATRGGDTYVLRRQTNPNTHEITVAKATKGIPGIVPFVETISTSSQTLLVQKYVGDTDVNDFMRVLEATGEAMAVPLFQRIGIGAASAVNAVNKAGYSHGDVTSRNIRIDEQIQPHLLDLGSARPITERKSREVFATPGFAAPEQYDGDTSPASDVYGTGAVLYHLAHGKQPMQIPGGMTLDEAREMMANPPLRQTGTGSPRLDSLLGAMLAFNATDRPTMPEVIAELKHL
uniref:Serine/threonine protein kinase n=1 Tax=uncultured marine group II/III euryarchaeote KM3_83_G03 TaxID=1456522 RepID=A0A075HS82_9EURY|nr:serine/threonine protein kinase [uncultured marine group II/III euryarchaeote KM3_83_G03]